MTDENVTQMPDDHAEVVNQMADEQLHNNDSEVEAKFPSAGMDMVSVKYVRNHSGFAAGTEVAVPRLVAVELEKFGIAEVTGEAPKTKAAADPTKVDNAPDNNS